MHSGSMVIFGGTTPEGQTNDVWSLAIPKSGGSPDARWRRRCSDRDCGDPIFKRTGHSAVLHGDAMLVFGGRSGSDGSMNDLWALNLSHSAPQWETRCSSLQYLLWGQCSSPPPVRYGHSAVLFGTRMVVFGGKVGPHERDDNDVWSIDVAAQHPTWVELCRNGRCGSPPPPRAFHSAVRLGQSMLVVGGGV